MSSTSALTLIILTVTFSASSRAKPGESEPRTLAIHPAQAALSLGDAVMALSPDKRSVLAFSPSGARLWRVGIGDQAGAKDLRVFGSALLAYAGQEVLSLDPASGKVLGRRSVSLPDPEQPEVGCELAHRDGVCALRCACSFELVHCDTLQTVGPKVDLKKLAPVGDATKSVCSTYSGALVGRAGDALIASSPIASDTPFFGVAEEALAVSATTGEVLWRAKGIGRLDPQLSGVTEDRASCFAGSRAGSVQVFDCQRATPRWRRDISIIKAIEPQVFAAGELLIVRDGRTLRGLALADGRERWALDLAQRTVAWPSRAGSLQGGASVQWSSRPDTLALIELLSGRRVGALPLPVGLNAAPLVNDQLIVALGREELVVNAASGDPLLTARRRPGERIHLADRAVGPALLFGAPERVELFVFDSANRTASLRAAFDGPLAKARLIGLFAESDSPERAGLRLDVVLLRDGKGGWDPSDPTTFGELHFLALDSPR